MLNTSLVLLEHFTLTPILDPTVSYVIQKRVDGNEDFEHKKWDDYVKGFGNVKSNYWMGLEEIHQLTSERDMSLEVDIETFSGGEPFTITYDRFSLADAGDNYRILLSGFSTSSDRLRDDPFKMVYGSSFTTRDRDNDVNKKGNCATMHARGGWWYRSCPMLNLNGNSEGDVRYPTGTGIYMQYIDTQSTTPNRAIKS